MSDDQLSDQGQDQGCKIQNKIQEPCKPTDTAEEPEILFPKTSEALRLEYLKNIVLGLFSLVLVYGRTVVVK